MKNFILPSLAIFVLIIASCTNSVNANKSKKQFPKPGTTVVSDKMPVSGDTLNHFTFSIKVVADTDVESGVYHIESDFGPNLALGQFTMPKGGEDFKPVIRRCDTPNTFIIGFKIPSDTTFYDYYEVSSTKESTRMRYLKAYSYN